MEKRHVEVLRAALVGDALGTPWTGLRFGHIQQVNGAPVEGFPKSFVRLPERPERNTTPGLHGIGGQVLLATLAAHGPDAAEREPAARVGAALLDLSGGTEPHPDRPHGALRLPGRPLRRSIKAWREGFPWAAEEWFAREEESEGVAACFPALGAALLFPDPSEAVGFARLTHCRFLAQVGAGALAMVLRATLAAMPRTPRDGAAVIRSMLPALRALEDQTIRTHARAWRDAGWERPGATLSAALEALPSLLEEDNDDVAQRTVVAGAAASLPSQPASHPQHGFIPAALVWALYRGLCGKPARVAVEDVLNRGGEGAFVASVVAALHVARRGPDCLPDEWYLPTLALAWVEPLLSGQQDAFTRWTSQETAWTEDEERQREPLRKAIEEQRAREAAREKERSRDRGPTPPGKAQLIPQSDADWAPPPHLWLAEGEEEDPEKKRLLKEARAKRRIDWKEDRRKDHRERGGEE